METIARFDDNVMDAAPEKGAKGELVHKKSTGVEKKISSDVWSPFPLPCGKQ